MKRLLIASTLTLLPLLSAIAPALASMEEAYEHANIAFAAIDDHADWDTGIINLERAIEASDDACMDSYYTQILELAQEAKNRRSQGASQQSTYRWFNYELEQNVLEDCQEAW